MLQRNSQHRLAKTLESDNRPNGWRGSAIGGPVAIGVPHGAALQTRATRICALVALLAFICLTSTVRAEVRPGDTAPPVMITNWIKQNPFGDWSKDKPLDLTEVGKGKVILLEFWATWCAPCIQIIPHNNELYQKYKDNGLLMISLTDTARGQQLSTVERFVEGRGNGMDYPVAFDGTQQTSLDYVYSAGGFGLPHAVLIDKKGKVAWSGHPMMPAMEQILEDLLLDRYDPEKLRAKAALEAKLEPIIMEFNRTASMGDWDKSLRLTDTMLDVDPSHEEAIRLTIMIHVNEIKDTNALRGWIAKQIDDHGDNPDAMLAMTHVLLDLDIENRQPDLALRAARAALAKKPRDTDAASALANVAYQIGNIDQAIAIQQQAVGWANIIQRDDAGARLAYFERCKALHGELETPAVSSK